MRRCGCCAVRQEVRSAWRFEDRAALEAVLRLEFPEELAAAWLGDHPDRVELSYGYVLFTVHKGRPAR